MKSKLLQSIIFCCVISIVAGLMTMPSHAAGDPGLNGYNYSIKTKVLNSPLISWTHIAVNQTGTADYVSYTVSRQKTFTGTVIAAVEINALTYKCGYSTEIAFSKTDTVKTTTQFSIPANSSITCRYGSAMVLTTGNMERWYYGRLMSSKGITEKYSRASYSDKVYN
jgi:hypothetical protein